jgi:SAM-dependent methyltransferase
MMAGDTIDRAEATKGRSAEAIYRMVASVIAKRRGGRGTLIDVGCGTGELKSYVAPLVNRYVGVDVVRYESFPPDAEFVQIDLDNTHVPLSDGSADIVAAVETIEHLENPRAFFRELRRLTKPGGLIIVTTPNQLSALSLLTLMVKGQFNAFQEKPGLYPSHITALLDVDLVRMATEVGLSDIEIVYSNDGRIPGTPWHWPANIFKGRLFSDNVGVSGYAIT